MAYNQKSMENLNRSGRKKGSKTIYRMQLVELQSEFDSIVGQSFPEIIRGIVNLALNSEDESIRLKAAQYLTNHIVGLPVQRIEQTTELIESEDIEQAKAMLKEKVGNDA